MQKNIIKKKKHEEAGGNVIDHIPAFLIKWNTKQMQIG
jgi:hypothetical protein